MTASFNGRSSGRAAGASVRFRNTAAPSTPAAAHPAQPIRKVLRFIRSASPLCADVLHLSAHRDDAQGGYPKGQHFLTGREQPQQLPRKEQEHRRPAQGKHDAGGQQHLPCLLHAVGLLAAVIVANHRDGDLSQTVDRHQEQAGGGGTAGFLRLFLAQLAGKQGVQPHRGAHADGDHQKLDGIHQ